MFQCNKNCVEENTSDKNVGVLDISGNVWTYLLVNYKRGILMHHGYMLSVYIKF